MCQVSCGRSALLLRWRRPSWPAAAAFAVRVLIRPYFLKQHQRPSPACSHSLPAPASTPASAPSSHRELTELGAELAAVFELMLLRSLEGKGTKWELLATLLRACLEKSLLQVGGVGWGGGCGAVGGGGMLDRPSCIRLPEPPRIRFITAGLCCTALGCRPLTWRRARGGCWTSWTTWPWMCPRRRSRWGEGAQRGGGGGGDELGLGIGAAGGGGWGALTVARPYEAHLC